MEFCSVLYDSLDGRGVLERISEVAQSCLTLCFPMDCNLPCSSIHGIFQARVLEWVAISFSRGSFRPRDRTQVSYIVGRHFTVWGTREDSYICVAESLCCSEIITALFVIWLCVWVSQLCLTLCDPMDCSLSDFSSHGILQARVLEWFAISFSRGSSWPKDWTQVSFIAGRFFIINSTPIQNKKLKEIHVTLLL